MINIKTLIILFTFFIYSITTFANSYIQDSIEQKSDSISFEMQRSRVNKFLDERSKNFGEYSTSLEKKTGVFGLFKTKKDMQKSIDILREIVLNDNNIFLETRKLLQLKDSQSERYQRLAQEYDSQVSAYMKTINKLQNENDRLRQEIENLEDDDRGNGLIIYLGIIIILGLATGIIFMLRKQKSKKITQ